ncbi:MAG: metal ABC transporter ATP-binding protein [Cryobacterium sp.]|nr:metal ABC transporter ATP-binding protein [Cryobacterium sp.]
MTTGAARADFALSVRDLSVRYGPVHALADVDIELGVGRVTALIGMNGSGKSSLFNAIMGRVRPASGEIGVFGQSSLAARRAGLVAYLPQQESIDWDFPISVRQVVMTGRFGMLGPTRRPRAIDREAVVDALRRVGLADLEERQIGELSGGQRKRVFLARSIAQQARLLLLDEPFAGVDKASEASIIALLHELRDSGCGILISTHDLAGVPELADEVVLLRNRVLFHGPTAEALDPAMLTRVFGLEASA